MSYWVKKVSGAAIEKNAIRPRRITNVHAPLDIRIRRSGPGPASSSTVDDEVSTVDRVSFMAGSVRAQRPGHRADQLVDRGLRGDVPGDPPAQAQHLDPVRHGQ